MTDTTPETDVDDMEFVVTAHFADTDAAERTIQQVFLGTEPAVYITPIETDDTMTFNVQCWDLDAPDLVDLLRLLADSIETAHERDQSEN